MNKKNIYESLDTLTEGELMNGDNCIFCPQCNKKFPALKSQSFNKLPRILMFVLKRFEFNYDTMAKIKINDFYEFPLELDMTKYIQNNEDNKYFLKSVVVHIGHSEGGHYYAYIKDEKTNSWHQFNDTSVTRFDINDLARETFGGKEEGTNENKNRSAYLLFYEKKDQKNCENFDKIKILNKLIKLNEKNKKKEEEEKKKEMEEENKKKKLLNEKENKKKIININNKKNLNQSKNEENKRNKNNLKNSINSQHKKPNLVAIGYQPNNNNFIKNNYNFDEGMVIGDFWKKYGDNPPIKPRETKRISVPKKQVKINKSLGCKLCEYCSNYTDDISKHYLECKAKKIIESEKIKYKNNLKNMTNNDEAMAKILQKKLGGSVNTAGDYALAKRLQRQFQPNTRNDEMMARNLQRQYQPNTRNDALIARRLQNQFKPNTRNDEIMAMNLQRQFGYKIPNTKNDAFIARKLQNQLKPNTKNDEILAMKLQKQFGYNFPNTQNDEIVARNLQNQFKQNTKDDEIMARNLQNQLNNAVLNDEDYARKLQEELNEQFNNDF